MYHVRRWRESTGYPLHSPVSPSLPLPCVTVCCRLYNLTLSNQAHVILQLRVSPSDLAGPPLLGAQTFFFLSLSPVARTGCRRPCFAANGVANVITYLHLMARLICGFTPPLTFSWRILELTTVTNVCNLAVYHVAVSRGASIL